VFQLFQAFRRAIRHRGNHKNLRCIALIPPAIKDKIFIPPKHIEDIA
jgi:hypothetical protein